jgi:hypothetical protein
MGGESVALRLAIASESFFKIECLVRRLFRKHGASTKISDQLTSLA